MPCRPTSANMVTNHPSRGERASGRAPSRFQPLKFFKWQGVFVRRAFSKNPSSQDSSLLRSGGAKASSTSESSAESTPLSRYRLLELVVDVHDIVLHKIEVAASKRNGQWRQVARSLTRPRPPDFDNIQASVLSSPTNAKCFGICFLACDAAVVSEYTTQQRHVARSHTRTRYVPWNPAKSSKVPSGFDLVGVCWCSFAAAVSHDLPNAAKASLTCQLFFQASLSLPRFLHVDWRLFFR